MAEATGIGTVEAVKEGASIGLLDQIRRPYKDEQGIFTRRIAYWCGVGLIAWGARDLWVWLQGFGGLRNPFVRDKIAGIDFSRLPLGGPALSGSVALAVLIGVSAWIWLTWFLKRPWLADLLIETESEMKKVSWPALDEATAATRVVTVAVLTFTVVLLLFDVVITQIMKLLTGLPL